MVQKALIVEELSGSFRVAFASDWMRWVVVDYDPFRHRQRIEEELTKPAQAGFLLGAPWNRKSPSS
jgi:hypothetical protein